MRGCARSDPAQYQHLTDDFDFDMLIMIYPQGDIPGNELRDYFTCAAAKAQGSSNLPGICDPAVDALVERVVTAQDRTTLNTAGRALDRVLLWRWYLVPNWDSLDFRIAYWNRFGHPDKPIREGLQLRFVVGGSGKGCGARRGKAAVRLLPPTPSRKGRGGEAATE